VAAAIGWVVGLGRKEGSYISITSTENGHAHTRAGSRRETLAALSVVLTSKIIHTFVEFVLGYRIFTLSINYLTWLCIRENYLISYLIPC